MIGQYWENWKFYVIPAVNLTILAIAAIFDLSIVTNLAISTGATLAIAEIADMTTVRLDEYGGY